MKERKCTLETMNSSGGGSGGGGNGGIIKFISKIKIMEAH